MKTSIILFLLTLICLESRGILCQPISWIQADSPSGGRIFCISSLPSGVLIAGAENSGIFRSIDNGETWQQTNLTDETLWSFARDSSGNLFAGTYGSGIYISTDEGITWLSLPSPPDYGILGLAVAPDNSLYAATNDQGVFRSTDHGLSWVQKNLLFPPLGKSIWSIGCDPSGIIYAGPANEGLYCSSDSGTSWENLPLTDQLSIQSFIVLNSSEFMIGTEQGIYESVDSGKSWSQLSSNLGNPFIEDLAISPQGILCAATMDGVFVSADSGKSWVQVISILPQGRFLSASANPHGDLFVGADGDGVYRSTDGGNTWDDVSQGITGLTIETITIDPAGKALAGTGRGIYASTDQGLSWTLSNDGITSFTNIVLFLPDGSVLAGGRSIFRSTDSGSSWTESSRDRECGRIMAFCSVDAGRIMAGCWSNTIYLSADTGKTWITQATLEYGVYTIIASADGLVLAGTERKGIYRSTDGGVNWSQSNDGLEDDCIFSLLISTDGYIYAGGLKGISRSANNGVTWSKVANIPTVSSLADDGAGNIYAGTDEGVFRSTDQGKSWINMGQPFNHSIRSLCFDINHFLYAGMSYGGIYRSNSPLDIPRPQYYSLSQNFPNPFNTGTTIEFTLPQKDRVEIVVFDLLGRQVSTIAGKDFPAGRHIIWWNPTSLSSGVYFYQLRSSWLSEVRKMVLVK